MPPENDGGESLAGYKIEWWPATATGGYGDPEIQTLKIGGNVNGETLAFISSFNPFGIRMFLYTKTYMNIAIGFQKD